MLIKVVVENYKSFDQREELSMISSSKIQTNADHRVSIKKTNILKHAAIYGANAAGKSNIVKAIAFMKSVLNDGLQVNSMNDYCRNKEENRKRESVFELLFSVGDKFYAYGFSAVLNDLKITGEWLYELNQNGSSNVLFTREGDNVPVLGNRVKLTEEEKIRFNVYAEDFAGHNTKLFLAEMNRGKRYTEDSNLLFFFMAWYWLKNQVVLFEPSSVAMYSDNYCNKDNVQKISDLMKTFDTGITEIETKEITLEELDKLAPNIHFSELFLNIQSEINDKDVTEFERSSRVNDVIFSVHIRKGEDPVVTTLVMKHNRSSFEFAEESEGTKRLFDLIEMLISREDDIVYVMDELETSLHPKMTEHFLELFMKAHKNQKTQLIFTTHEAAIMDLNLFRMDEIWFVERNADNASTIYSLDKFKERYDKKISKAYLNGRYGAVPVFKQFSFEEEEDTQ